MKYMHAPPCNYFSFWLHLVHSMVSCAAHLTLVISSFSAFDTDLGRGSQRAISESAHTWF